MQELLDKLEALKKDENIKKHCDNRIFLNNKDQSVQMPYISVNPNISGKALAHHAEGHIFDKYTCQINFYCDSRCKFIEVYNAIRKCMEKQGFKANTEFIDTTEKGIWICFRYTITI